MQKSPERLKCYLSAAAAHTTTQTAASETTPQVNFQGDPFDLPLENFTYDDDDMPSWARPDGDPYQTPTTTPQPNSTSSTTLDPLDKFEDQVIRFKNLLEAVQYDAADEMTMPIITIAVLVASLTLSAASYWFYKYKTNETTTQQQEEEMQAVSTCPTLAPSESNTNDTSSIII